MNISFSAPNKYIDKLNETSVQIGLTKSEIVRRAIDLYYHDVVNQSQKFVIEEEHDPVAVLRSKYGL